MDAAYKQHSSQSRRKNRSSTNLNHLSLAPLTTKLPINDNEMIFSDLTIQTYGTSYIQGKSAPTTPSLLTRSPLRGTSANRLHSARGTATPLPKSKSASHLTSKSRRPSPRSGSTTPGGHRRGSKKEEPVSARSRTDSDWLLRAGVLISSETRESKGQSWLVSRVSSTSLTGMRGARDDDEDDDPDMFERERIARENAISSRQASRRASLALAGMEDDPPFASRHGSVFASRHGSRSQLVTPGERTAIDGYFAQHTVVEDYGPGPDFVNLDENLEATGIEEDMGVVNEADVRRLVKSGNAQVGTWFGNVLGWTLFSVEENEEEDADEATDVETEEGSLETPAERQFEGVTSLSEQQMPPPKADEGGWQDAAWLLSVASKVAWS